MAYIITSQEYRKILFDEKDIIKKRHSIKGSYWGDVITSRQNEDGCNIFNKTKRFKTQKKLRIK